jgi:predicted RNase H-like HicB family nuclease
LPEDEGGAYLIQFRDLPDCLSDGEMIAAAIKNGVDAMQGWIAPCGASDHASRRSQTA